MAQNVANIRLGQCDITYNSQALGHTKGGVEVKVTSAVNEVTVDEYGTSPVKANNGGTRIEIKTTLSEYSYAILLKVINGAVDALSGDAVAIGKDGGTALAGATLTLHPHGVTGTALDVTVWKAVLMGESKLPFKLEEETTYEVSWIGLADTSKAEGQMLARFGTPT